MFLTVLIYLTMTIPVHSYTNYSYQCVDSSSQSNLSLSCGVGLVIVVESAIVGLGSDDKYCPNPNLACRSETTVPAEYCTGYNNCTIPQTLLFYNVCSANGGNGVNFAFATYSCIYPSAGNYGDICHFDGPIDSSNSIFLSSYPNFPGDIPSSPPFNCSCSITPIRPISAATLRITLRLHVVALKIANCSDQLIYSSGQMYRHFCSATTTVNLIQTNSPGSNVTISFQRRSSITSSAGGKFFLQLDVNGTTGTGTIANVNCVSSFSAASISTSTSSWSNSPVPSASSLSIPTRAITTSPLGVISIPMNSQTTSSNTAEYSSSNLNYNSTSAAFSIHTDNTVTPCNTSGNSTCSANYQNVQHQVALSAGAIAGIVLGSIGFLLLLFIIAFLLVRSRRSKRNKKTVDAQDIQPSNNLVLHDNFNPDLQPFHGRENGRYSAGGSFNDHYGEAALVQGTSWKSLGNGRGASLNDELGKVGNGGIGNELYGASAANDVIVSDNQLYQESTMTSSVKCADADYEEAQAVLGYGNKGTNGTNDPTTPGMIPPKTTNPIHRSAPVQLPHRTIGKTPQLEQEGGKVNELAGTTKQTTAEEPEVVLVDNSLYGSLFSL